jgi:hypothetical protein
MEIKTLIKEFTNKPGNSVVSEQLLYNFYKYLQSENFMYQMLAERLNLIEEKHNHWVNPDTPDLLEYELTRFGFRQKI